MAASGEQTPAPAAASSSHYKGFVAGIFSGVTKLAVGHPFDTIKVRLQTTTADRFAGPLACFVATVRNEGVRALYKGATPPLVGWMFMDSVMLGSLTVYKKLLGRHWFGLDESSAHGHSAAGGPALPTYGHAIAGVGAGITVSFVAAPFEHIKARLQVQYAANKAERLYHGPIDCLAKVYRYHGLRHGVYRGLGATMLFRSFFFFWWGSYDLFSRQLHAHFPAMPAALVNFWAGGLSAQVFWTVAYPSDVVKQRIMTDPLGGGLHDGTPRFPRWRDAATAVYREAGVRGFFRGFVPSFLRAFPANAMALVAFEAAMRTLP